jgi:hypothetical protein
MDPITEKKNATLHCETRCVVQQLTTVLHSSIRIVQTEVDIILDQFIELTTVTGWSSRAPPFSSIRHKFYEPFITRVILTYFIIETPYRHRRLLHRRRWVRTNNGE